MTGPVLIEERAQPAIRALMRFMERRWVDAFRAGHLRMGTVERYRKDYENQEGGRNDPDEHVQAIFQPDQVTIRIGEHVIGGVQGPVRIRRQFDACSYVLCMTAITDRDLDRAFGPFKLDRRLLGLGDAAVAVTHGREFLRRLKAGIDKVPWLRSHPGSKGSATGLVEYVDFATHHGEVGPFRKFDVFRCQHEWRLALIDSTEGRREDPLTLEVGDISGITTVVDTEKLVTEGAVADVVEEGAA